jgi:hypothetical protein
VVRLIDSIAGQTNLQALNATIKAARAGDAGKGFAVVAGEVKALAAQTAKAAAEISAQIETVRGATEDTVVAMNEIGSIIGRMGEVSTAIAAAVEEQSATTREIASAIQEVAGLQLKPHRLWGTSCRLPTRPVTPAVTSSPRLMKSAPSRKSCAASWRSSSKPSKPTQGNADAANGSRSVMSP